MEVQYNLMNSFNFNKILKNSLNDLLEKYVCLILEYYKYILEKVNLTNKKYQEFIVKRGLDTISHVFLMILFYTKNIDFAYYHSQKSFYFYVEFIEQITVSSIHYLPISSRDASIFVYKKTIYEISSTYRKSVEVEPYNDVKIDILKLCIEIYKLLPSDFVIDINNIILHNSKLHNKNSLHIIYLFFEKMSSNEWDMVSSKKFLNKIKSITNPTIIQQMTIEILHDDQS